MPVSIRRAIGLVALLTVACAPRDDDADGAAADTGADTPAAASLTSIADIGLETPESVLHDEQADIYLVSNINGEPLGRDDNGFISRISPDGAVQQLKWIDGAADNVTLHAPKGMALRGDTLFVSDIDSVRAFHRTTGAPLGARGVPGASFLNDLAIGPDGVLYVTDSGLDESFSGTGTDAIHRFTAGGPGVVASGALLAAPNGLVVDDSGFIVVGFGGNTVQRVSSGGATPSRLATLPAGQLDGIIRMSDGSLLVSSWEGKAIYRIAPDGRVSTVVENVEAPADIGYDARRHRVLIPLFLGNRIEIREIH